MSLHKLKRLPVVDGSGRLCGWVSRVDILRVLEHKRPVFRPAEAEGRQTSPIADQCCC